MLILPAVAQDIGSARSDFGDLKSAVAPALDSVSAIFELAGVTFIVVGVLLATWTFLAQGRRSGWWRSYRDYRANIGRAILLGLELLVAADIIGTVAVRPTLSNVLVLGLIIIIRTFLSFSLEVEIEGAVPWRRREASNG